VAAEANNKICNVGVAYDARIGGSRGLVVCFIKYVKKVKYASHVV